MKWLSFLLLWLCSGYSLAAPALWSATKGEQQLWLFGSIHLADARLATLPDALLQRLHHTKHLYLEVDPRRLNTQALMPFITLADTDKETTSWSRRLSPDLDAQLSQRLAEFNLTQLSTMTPWFAAMQLGQVQAKQLGFVSQQGVDMQLLAQAQQHDYQISGLEPPTLVFELMASLSELGLEQDFVRHALDEQEQMAEHLEQLFSTWQSGDQQALLALLDDQGSPELGNFIRQELLWSRNQAWLNELKQQAPKQALIVVGALHLYGEQGLLKLLRTQGYHIEQTNI